MLRIAPFAFERGLIDHDRLPVQQFGVDELLLHRGVRYASASIRCRVRAIVN
jgi:hypothetical protein